MKRAFTAFILLFLLAVGCSNSTGPKNKTHAVLYEVQGSTVQVFVTIENEDGGTSQFDKISPPWTYSFPDKKDEGTFVFISAQNQTDRGSVTVNIYRDGDLFKTATSTGAYVIAEASGSL